MKYLIISTILLTLTSCFKVDDKGDAFLFESENYAAIKINFSNLTSTSYYFGANNEISTSASTVKPFTVDKHWCLGRFYFNVQSGTYPVPGGTFLEVLNSAGGGIATALNSGDELNASLPMGEAISFRIDCSSCAATSGYFTVELNNCNN